MSISARVYDNNTLNEMFYRLPFAVYQNLRVQVQSGSCERQTSVYEVRYGHICLSVHYYYSQMWTYNQINEIYYFVMCEMGFLRYYYSEMTQWTFLFKIMAFVNLYGFGVY